MSRGAVLASLLMALALWAAHRVTRVHPVRSVASLRAPTAAPTAAVETTAVVARGREVFRDAECASCHDPEQRFTDGHAHVLGGLRGDELIAGFDTPSLLGVRDTAPYFHDGRYPTLDALLRDPRHRMGDLTGVGADDRAALVAFLETP